MGQDSPNYFFAELQAGLQSRAIVTPLPASIRPWQTVFLRSGSLLAEGLDGVSSSGPQTISAPALMCWPAEAQLQLTLLAGSTGLHLALGEMFLVSVLGKRPEANELREAVLNTIALPLADKPQTTDRIQIILDEIAREQEGTATGQLLVVEAQLRCLMVHLWRHAQRTDEPSIAAGQQTIILRKFRQLVEAHFHDRWRVSDYASALNITADRLHNVSTKSLGKTPLDLIHERIHREAQALLARSNMTLDQIAAHLNFKTTQQFSAFFRNRENVPPGKFRKTMTGRPGTLSEPVGVEFSDWP